jgi:hypothetical protein
MPDQQKRNRRSLKFDRLDQIMPEVRRLERGCVTVGRWSFAGICHHLAGTFNGSIDGFDLSRHRIKRILLRRLLWRLTLRYGIPENYTVNPHLTPPEDVNPTVAVAALEQAIQRYDAYSGPLQAHPLFGRLDRAEWDRMHLIHTAHHLSFAIPHNG